MQVWVNGNWIDSFGGSRRRRMECNLLPPIREAPKEVSKLDRDQILIPSYVGGLVKSLERKAA
jgi:hypothetical protein